MKLNRELRNIFIIYAITITFWLSLVIYREMKKEDIMILRRDYLKVNGWSIMHFLNYAALGYFAPSYWKHLIVIGFLFEVAEIPLNRVSNYIDSKIVSDTLVNSLGVIFGYFMSSF